MRCLQLRCGDIRGGSTALGVMALLNHGHSHAVGRSIGQEQHPAGPCAPVPCVTNPRSPKDAGFILQAITCRALVSCDGAVRTLYAPAPHTPGICLPTTASAAGDKTPVTRSQMFGRQV